MALPNKTPEVDIFKAVSAFERGKQENYEKGLLTEIASKDEEIKFLCGDHYQDFVSAVDEMLTVREEIGKLRETVTTLNEEMHRTGAQLLSKEEELLRKRRILENIDKTITRQQECMFILQLYGNIQNNVKQGRYLEALKLLDRMLTAHLRPLRSFSFARQIESDIPELKAGFWHCATTVTMNSIRKVSAELGKAAMRTVASQLGLPLSPTLLATLSPSGLPSSSSSSSSTSTGAAPTAPSRRTLAPPGDLPPTATRSTTRPATGQSMRDALLGRPDDAATSGGGRAGGRVTGGGRSGGDERVGRRGGSLGGTEGDLAGQAAGGDGADGEPVSLFEQLKVDLTPVFQCMAIAEHIGRTEEFCKYYNENRKLQVDLDLDPSNAFRNQPFHEFYARYMSQLLGYFIVEDAIFKGLPALMQSSEVESLWNLSVVKIKDLLEQMCTKPYQPEAPPRINQVKDFLLVYAATATRYGYNAGLLTECLVALAPRVIEMLAHLAEGQLNEALKVERYEPLLIEALDQYEKLIKVRLGGGVSPG
ncbi:putative exocyst complex subunit 6 [Paratrimastix pyriformis]|uniref:Exocyst complex subunit 6 n=1 Tax=Paratrimastix pyriformis TaxID=342808 RepID=A0ABQ8UF15_9EUKA|nr:putative exocyst complex subunit 6 [Paratrimastix pyriformis]